MSAIPAPVAYWLFSGSFLAAVAFHLIGSLLILFRLFWQDDTLVDWHGNCMLAALALAVCGTVFARLLPPL